ncbi:MAG TPA: hypothetical protein VLZ74_16115 [Methylocella sp.]|nr:hypothetical protein [Methylocella sp.]
MKKLSGHHDLGQGQGIDKGKPLVKNQIFFIQNERFMKGEQTQQNPEICKDPEEFSCFADGSSFQAAESIIHHVPTPSGMAMRGTTRKKRIFSMAS